MCLGPGREEKSLRQHLEGWGTGLALPPALVLRPAVVCGNRGKSPRTRFPLKTLQLLQLRYGLLGFININSGWRWPNGHPFDALAPNDLGWLRERREPLQDKTGESTLLSRSGGEKGPRCSGAGTLGVTLKGTRHVGELLDVASRVSGTVSHFTTEHGTSSPPTWARAVDSAAETGRNLFASPGQTEDHTFFFQRKKS